MYHILRLLAASGLLLASFKAMALQPNEEKLLDEVLVVARRAELSELRRQMVELEDLYYKRFNEINTDDQFDIHCSNEARAGTLIRRRSCRAVYELRALEREAQEHYRAMPKSSDPTPRPWTPPIPAIVDIERRREDSRKTLLEVTRKSPELIELLQQRAELAERYDAKRRELFKFDE